MSDYTELFDPEPTVPVGRIDYLGTDGTIGESVEYFTARKLEYDIKNNAYCSVPMSIVLYADKQGNVVPHDYLFDCNPVTTRLKTIPNPYLSEHQQEPTQPTIQEQLTSAQTEADKRNAEAAAEKDMQEHRPEKSTQRP